MKFTLLFLGNLLRRPMIYISSAFVIGALSQFITAYDLAYAYTLPEATLGLLPVMLIFGLASYGVVEQGVGAFREASVGRDIAVFLTLEALGKKKHASTYALSRFAS